MQKIIKGHSIEGNAPLDLGEILRLYGGKWLNEAEPTGRPYVRRVLRALAKCRTPALGGHRYACTSCERAVVAYNSCRDRHCPKCLGAYQYRWIEARKARLLNSGYFHVVFTLPEALRSIAKRNPSKIYALIMRSAAETLVELGKDPRRLGGLVGVTAILHTWTRTLAYHPHVHCVVTAGGLAADDSRWIASRQAYLFPVRVMGALFRGKVLAGIESAFAAGKLIVDEGSLKKLLSPLRSTSWVVYAKRPFGGAMQVFRYLGRYTHRVGIANSRLRAVTDEGITFQTRGDGLATLVPEEFVRRFAMHILPPGFVKIRHYGLLASSHVKSKLVVAQQKTGGAPVLADVADALSADDDDDAEPEDSGESRMRSDAAVAQDRHPDFRSLVSLLIQGEEPLCPWCRRGVFRYAETDPP